MISKNLKKLVSIALFVLICFFGNSVFATFGDNDAIPITAETTTVNMTANGSSNKTTLTLTIPGQIDGKSLENNANIVANNNSTNTVKVTLTNKGGSAEETADLGDTSNGTAATGASGSSLTCQIEITGTTAESLEVNVLTDATASNIESTAYSSSDSYVYWSFTLNILAQNNEIVLFPDSTITGLNFSTVPNIYVSNSDVSVDGTVVKGTPSLQNNKTLSTLTTGTQAAGGAIEITGSSTTDVNAITYPVTSATAEAGTVPTIVSGSGAFSSNPTAGATITSANALSFAYSLNNYVLTPNYNTSASTSLKEWTDSINPADTLSLTGIPANGSVTQAGPGPFINYTYNSQTDELIIKTLQDGTSTQLTNNYQVLITGDTGFYAGATCKLTTSSNALNVAVTGAPTTFDLTPAALNTVNIGNNNSVGIIPFSVSNFPNGANVEVKSIYSSSGGIDSGLICSVVMDLYNATQKGTLYIEATPNANTTKTSTVTLTYTDPNGLTFDKNLKVVPFNVPNNNIQVNINGSAETISTGISGTLNAGTNTFYYNPKDQSVTSDPYGIVSSTAPTVPSNNQIRLTPTLGYQPGTTTLCVQNIDTNASSNNLQVVNIYISKPNKTNTGTYGTIEFTNLASNPLNWSNNLTFDLDDNTYNIDSRWTQASYPNNGYRVASINFKGNNPNNPNQVVNGGIDGKIPGTNTVGQVIGTLTNVSNDSFTWENNTTSGSGVIIATVNLVGPSGNQIPMGPVYLTITKNGYDLTALAFSSQPVTGFSVKTIRPSRSNTTYTIEQILDLFNNSNYVPGSSNVDVFAKSPNYSNWTPLVDFPLDNGNDVGTLEKALEEGLITFYTSNPNILSWNPRSGENGQFVVGNEYGQVNIYVATPEGDVSSADFDNVVQFLPVYVQTRVSNVDLTDETLQYFNTTFAQNHDLGFITTPEGAASANNFSWTITGPGTTTATFREDPNNILYQNNYATVYTASNGLWTLVVPLNDAGPYLQYSGDGGPTQIGTYTLTCSASGTVTTAGTVKASATITVGDTNVNRVWITDEEGNNITQPQNPDLSKTLSQQFDYVAVNSNSQELTGKDVEWTLSFASSVSGFENLAPSVQQLNPSDYAVVDDTGLVTYLKKTPESTPLYLLCMVDGVPQQNPVPIEISNSGASANLTNIKALRNPIYLSSSLVTSTSPYELVNNIIPVPTGASFDPADLTFESSNPSVQFSARNGEVWSPNIYFRGTTTITATLQTDTDTTYETEFDVIFTQTVPANGVTAEETLELVIPGSETANVNANLNPSNSTSQATYSYTSSNSSVAIVDVYGNVTAVAPGSAVITTTAKVGPNTYTATTNVTVTEEQITSLTITPATASLSLAEGGNNTVELTATTDPADAADGVTWTIDNEEVATINPEQGATTTVTAVSVGTATVTATLGDQTATATITVSENLTPTSFTVSPDPMILTTLNGTGYVNTDQLDVTLSPAGSAAATTFVSSAPTIATVDAEGNVTAKAEGTANITVTVGDLEPQTVKVIVANTPLVATDLDISAANGRPDYFNVSLTTVPNSAIGATAPAAQASFFAWSDDNQSDINAKVMTSAGNGVFTLNNVPVNDTPRNNYFLNADDIKVNVYASPTVGQNGSMVARTTYSWVEDVPENLYYIGYTQNIGFDLPSVTNGQMTGTQGQVLQMEGLRVSSNIEGVEILTDVHMQDLGWYSDLNNGAYLADGQYAGTMWDNRQIEAVRFQLVGPNASNYTISARAHVEDYGWMPTVTGQRQIVGTTNQNKQLEAIEITLTPINQ